MRESESTPATDSGSLLEREEKFPFPNIDPVVVEAELRKRAKRMQDIVARLEETQVVTQEIMQLEFNV